MAESLDGVLWVLLQSNARDLPKGFRANLGILVCQAAIIKYQSLIKNDNLFLTVLEAIKSENPIDKYLVGSIFFLPMTSHDLWADAPAAFIARSRPRGPT